MQPRAMSEARFLGIDFSGGSGPWKASCAKPTVWIATLEAFRLADLRPVQSLEGEGEPFDRLVALLREGKYRAAAIDAPFSLPAAHLPLGGHHGLLADIGLLAAAEDRPFPRGEAVIAYADAISPIRTAKVWRQTERECGALARSTLWNGARPGAPFTAACLTLLVRAQRPIWPWRDAPGMLVEAFPAAQLRAWGLPNAGYGLPSEKPIRARIIAALEQRGLAIDPNDRKQMLVSPDALDAVIAAFAGRAAANRQLKHERPPNWRLEGAIAVHA
jgi:lambda repressor-like predicted transcriptional regulator